MIKYGQVGSKLDSKAILQVINANLASTIQRVSGELGISAKAPRDAK